MTVCDSAEALAIQTLIGRFANTIDMKAWGDLAGCLAASLHTDYSDLRGTPPEIMPRERFVELRQTALELLETHHLAGNVEIRVDGPRGDARVSMAIFRRNHQGQVFNTHCVYELGVEKQRERWVIRSIQQRVLWSEGERDIHRGAR
jgi:hypothetical protein